MTTEKTLKVEIKEELENQKEIKREENRKLNANLREVILYTKETCPYCINFIKLLDDDTQVRDQASDCQKPQPVPTVNGGQAVTSNFAKSMMS